MPSVSSRRKSCSFTSKLKRYFQTRATSFCLIKSMLLALSTTTRSRSKRRSKTDNELYSQKGLTHVQAKNQSVGIPIERDPSYSFRKSLLRIRRAKLYLLWQVRTLTQSRQTKSLIPRKGTHQSNLVRTLSSLGRQISKGGVL